MHLRWEGTITLTALKDVAESTWAHPDYDPDFFGLYDVRGARLSLSPREVGALWHFLRRDARYIRNRFAIVINAPVPTPLATLFAARSPYRRIGIFSTPEAANTWLMTGA
ncbi:MAG: hypothetical protein AAGJ10_19915 [Bacteroidota bacterium]